MGTFDTNRAALDSVYATGMDRIGEEFDGQAPKTKPVAPPPAVVNTRTVPATVEDTGPGFWSRLGSGIAAVAGNTANLVDNVASRVEFRSISGARANAASQAAPPPQPEPNYGVMMSVAAAALVVLAALTRK